MVMDIVDDGATGAELQVVEVGPDPGAAAASEAGA